LNSQPAPYGSELISPGFSSISGLTSVTSPSTGEYRSLTDLVDSTSPQGSPAVTLVPGAGMDTYTTSPSAFCAWSVMPTVAVDPSMAVHSCSAVYCSSSGTVVMVAVSSCLSVRPAGQAGRWRSRL
jgi:hypothetical protein